MRLLALALAILIGFPARAQMAVSPLYGALVSPDTIQVIAPTTGSTVTPDAGVTVLLINNPSVLATLTIDMPVGIVDGQRLLVASNGGVTILTINGNIRGTIAALAANGYARFFYSASLGTWFRTG